MASALVRDATRSAFPREQTVSSRLLEVGYEVADRTLLDTVNVTLAPGEKVAISGDNGSGKTTLLRLASGLLDPCHGRVHCDGARALLAQLDSDAPGPEATLLAAVRSEHPEPRPGVFDKALRGAGLDPFAPPWALSGGERQRARLALLLALPVELLCLDEPTNHLDTDGMDWLQARLRASPAAMLLVDHDRTFLSSIANRTGFLAQGSLDVYPGGYQQACDARDADRAAQRRRHEAQVSRQRALREAADRERARARSAGHFDHRRADGQASILVKGKAESASRTHARASAAMRVRLARETPEAKPFEDRRRVRFSAGSFEPGPQEVLVASDIDVERGGRRLVSDLTLYLRRGERLALTGPNGSGKTTLLEVLAGRRPPNSGTVRHGSGLRLLDVAQADWAPSRCAASRSGHATVGALLRAERPALNDSEVWETTAAVGVASPPERVLTELSGGERQRLEVARLSVTSAQWLVLDEPTLHLDVRAIEALETLLAEYPGTLLFVSHDRALVARIASRRLALDGEGGWTLD